MKLYDIGPSIPFDTAAYNDWKNGDLEVVMENTVFYVQNCSGNELLLKQCTSRTLSSQEIDAVSTGMVTLEQLGVESQYYPIQLYGTASDVAKWCLNHSRELGNRTGGYVQDLVQHNLPTGLMLFKQEEDNVWTRPAQRTGRIPLDIIGHPVNGYGTITWRKLDGKRDEDLDE